MATSIRVAALAVTMLAAMPALAEAPGEQGPRTAARAKTAMASSNHPLVTQVMVDVMKRGGNAMDAALVATILQPVVEPQMSTIAGDMALLYYEAKTGKYYYLNAELDHTMKGSPASVVAMSKTRMASPGRPISMVRRASWFNLTLRSTCARIERNLPAVIVGRSSAAGMSSTCRTVSCHASGLFPQSNVMNEPALTSVT